MLYFGKVKVPDAWKEESVIPFQKRKQKGYGKLYALFNLIDRISKLLDRVKFSAIYHR